jgi:hypothetical protein
MDFFTHNLKKFLTWKPRRASHRLVWCLGLAFMLGFAPLSKANDVESIRVIDPSFVIDTEGDWGLNTNVAVALNPVLVDAVNRGVPLYFIMEFELSRDRWYWFDERVIRKSKTARLTYHAITQQYRVAFGGLHQLSFPTLEEALSGALTLRGWMIAGIDNTKAVNALKAFQKKPGDFEARFRVRLDSSQLPKPLQVNAFTNRDWALSSDWVTLKPVIAAIEGNL